MTHKTCRGCGESKPFDAFSRAAKGDRNGLASRCKKCRAARNLLWHQNNKIRSKELKDRWQAENLESERAKARDRARADPDRHAAYARTWREKNPARNAAKASRYKASQLQATPSWLTAIQLAQIEEFYEIAAARTVQTGVQHHVDHTHPLQGENFRGLHVPWNLQVLTAFANVSKKNRLEA